MKVFTPVPLLKVITKVSHNCDDRAPSRRRHPEKAVFEWRCGYGVAVSLAGRGPCLVAGIFEGRYGIVERHLTRGIYKGKEVVFGGNS